MKLQELFEDFNSSMYDVENDKRVAHLQDTRKPRITLRHLHKLRKYHEFRDAQDQRREDIVSTVYKAPAESNPVSPMGAM